MDEPRCRGRGRRCGASSMQLRREAWPGAGGARRNPPLPGLCWGGWALLSAGAVRGRSGTASPGPGPEGQHTHQLDALRKGVVLPVLLGEALQNLSLSIPAACRKERRIRGQAASRGRRAELQQHDTPTDTAEQQRPQPLRAPWHRDGHPRARSKQPGAALGMHNLAQQKCGRSLAKFTLGFLPPCHCSLSPTWHSTFSLNNGTERLRFIFRFPWGPQLYIT